MGKVDNDRLTFALRSRARREDTRNQAETAAQLEAGRCECGCGLPAAEGSKYHATCAAKRALAKKNAFVGL